MRKFVSLLACLFLSFYVFSQTIQPSGPTSFCEGGNVELKALTQTGTNSFQWRKDGVDIANAINDTYVATLAGSYTVIVTQNGNKVEYAPVVVTVKTNPVASFTFAPKGQCANTPVYFTNTSTGTGLTYIWNFDDQPSGGNNTSNQINPAHRFIGNNGGTTQNFNVKLTTKSSDNCSNTAEMVVTVNQTPNTQLGGTGYTTYNNLPYFTQCQAAASTFTFYNQSSTTSTNTNYAIQWGDGSTDFTAASFQNTTHTYPVGNHTLRFIVTGANGCKDTGTYYVFVGSNPAVGLGNPGNTNICTGTSLTFPISGTTNNPPGTVYTVTFNDGTAPLVFNHPAPANVTHTFNTGSCGITSGSFPNSFSATIQASNPCGTSAASVVPIYVSEKPRATFTITPKDTVCVGTLVSLTNTGINGTSISTQGVCTQGKSIWTITPATGWSVSSGSLGNDYGADDPSVWVSGTSPLKLNFNTPGVYTVKLKVGGNSLCGSDFIEKTICVNPTPVAAFNVDQNAGCAPLTVNTTNTSNAPNCGNNQYSWSVSYSNPTGCTPGTSSFSYINGTNATSVNPQYLFTNPGVYTISLTTYSPGSACVSTVVYKTITVKSKPVVSLPASVTICQNSTINPAATVNSCNTNAPSYSWSFPGGTPSSSTSSNPGSIAYNNAGTYSTTLTVTNECGATTVTQQVTVKPTPDAIVPNNQSVCTGVVVSGLSLSSSLPGTILTWTNNNVSIGLPASGSGSLPSFNAVNSGSTPVVATITVIPSNNGCNGPSSTFTITVNPKPSTPGVSSPVTYCQNAQASQLTATPTNSTNTLNWYTSASGGTPLTMAPTPSTTTVGNTTYYLSQTNASGCEGPRASITVNIAVTPNISSSSSTNPLTCGGSNGSIILNGLSPNTSYSISYSKNGTNINATLTADASGIVRISNLQAATYSNIIAKINSCTSNAVGPFTLTDPNPPATPTVNSNAPICSGSLLNLTSSTSSTGNIIYNWTGPNGFTSNLQNPSISNVTTGASGSYTLTISLNGCTASSSLNVLVNAKTAKISVTSPIAYCLNDIATTLNATAASGNTLKWYDGSNNPLSEAPTPSTNVAGTFYYAVTQTSANGCESDTAKIAVIVSPTISGNTIGNDQTLCYGNTPSTLTSSGNVSGGTGTYIYQWQQSTDGGSTWTNIASANSASYSPGPLTSTTKYKRIVSSGPCQGSESNIVTITIQGILTNYDIAASQTICAGIAPTELNGQTPLGGNGMFDYQWQSSTNNNSWSDIPSATNLNYTPGILTSTTYFRRKVTSGSCAAVSSTATITVNPIPVMSSIANYTYCNNSSTGAISFSSTPSTNVSYAWINDNTSIGLSASGTGNLPAFNATNNSSLIVPLEANLIVTPTYNSGGTTCPGNSTSFKLIVLPTITIKPIANEVVCTGATIPAVVPEHNAGNFNGSEVKYSWDVSGSGITLQSGTGIQIPSYTATNNGTSDVVATITVTPQYTYNGQTCNGQQISYAITVKPGTPKANAGPDQTLCAANAATLQAQLPAGTTGLWTLLGTSTATILDPSSPTTKVTALTPGNTYQFEWEVKGFASCPSTRDTIIITNYNDLINDIDITPKTICVGQSVTINGSAPSGGNGSYQYQWQQSIDGITWSNIAGQTNLGLFITPTQTTYFRRMVLSQPCSKESMAILVIVQAAVSNNTIAADQTLCTGNTAAIIKGSNPSGGNNQFLYVWEQSIDNGITWSVITGATATDYLPGILNQTTRYRRKVATNLCSGPQQSTSNVTTITVRPDAKAVFAPTTTLGCAPFNITAGMLNVQTFPSNNGQYQWYVNSNLVGNGSNFPGYTMTSANDTAAIMLKAISLYGCKADSMAHSFYTYKVPQPSFTLSDTAGCGPLTVQIQNTTGDLSSYSYQWDFGNGQTSSATQPGAITFQPNPTYGDTTYYITLKVSSACGVYNFTKSVYVQSKPKALFAPSRTVGCSPMTVVFNNTSLGVGNSYSWDFGDGGIAAVAVKDSISHTYYTSVRDTFYTKLVAVNGCGSDSLRYAIIVTPNTIKLDFAVDGLEQSGCEPHNVRFINNSKGATNFRWDFGDGNIQSTTKNVDTVAHLFLLPGTYTVKLRAYNSCSDTTATEVITVYPKPRAAFTVNQSMACIGDVFMFTNLSDSATSYLWQFGDGNTSSSANPTYSYRAPGNYKVTLTSYRFNAPGSVCVDSISIPVSVVASLPGTFSVSDSLGACPPFNVTFRNQNIPAQSVLWDFGDGTSAGGDFVTHTYLKAGVFQAKATVLVPGGCTYITSKTINVSGPSGSFTYTKGLLCNNETARFEATVSNTDSLIWDFGDGVILRSTQRVVYHSFDHPGAFIPSVVLISKSGCKYPINGVDTIKVDKVTGGYSTKLEQYCGYTNISFADTSHAFYGKATVSWFFGDGTSANGATATHTYTVTGNYTIKMIIVGNSGCADTVTKQLQVQVNSKPIATITGVNNYCANALIGLNATIQSIDNINLVQWTTSNGLTGNTNPFNIRLQPGNYSARVVVGTVNGCYDTAYQQLQVNPAPVVTTNNDLNICRGNSVQLNATGATQLQWSPLQGLSCTNCANPVALPLATTPYIVKGTNSFGCSAEDTVVVTVIQPLKLTVSPNDSICIGRSTQLFASGATTYSWSPATSLSNTNTANPTASPAVTTQYRVIGKDGYNCFTDTAFVTVAIGQYPNIELGPDVSLATGTLYPLKSTVENGPIRRWQWTPGTNLSCNTCPLPIAEVKKDITYYAIVTNAYGCSATDTISIKAFCESAQVFVPNAFTPDGDGVNDLLMVRGSGIVTVKHFRIFNRWGELIFERSSFPPNDNKFSWDGRIRGVISGPDVFVYTAEVICENGASYTYKGNVSVLK